MVSEIAHPNPANRESAGGAGETGCPQAVGKGAKGLGSPSTFRLVEPDEMKADPPPTLDYGVQKSSPDVADVKRRLKRLFTIIAIVWFVLYLMLLIVGFFRGDPSK
jgi:hypothetical protein